MDFRVRLPVFEDFSYPVNVLNPKAKENIIIGKKLTVDKNYKEHRNMAIAALASAAIMFVAASIASHLALPFLLSAFSTSALLLSVGGSTYFVVTRLLDPRAKIENLKDQFRDALLQKVLQKSCTELEGYDLLQKAIEDRTQDPKIKEMVYLCIRQLRRNFEKIHQLKIEKEQSINRAYKNYFEDLLEAKNAMIVHIYNAAISDDEKRAAVSEVKRSYKKYSDKANSTKYETIRKVQEEYQNAINGLEKQYEKLLDDLGSKQGFARVIEIGMKGSRKIGSLIGWGFDRASEMLKWTWGN